MPYSNERGATHEQTKLQHSQRSAHSSISGVIVVPRKGTYCKRTSMVPAARMCERSVSVFIDIMPCKPPLRSVPPCNSAHIQQSDQ